MRKNFANAPKINNELMWLHSFYGIDREFDKAFQTGHRNGGIWAPDGGACELGEQIKQCVAHEGSELYSWSKRQKACKLSIHNQS